MSKAGALFDLLKLTDISKTYISKMSAEEVYAAVIDWAAEYAPAFYAQITKDPAYTKRVFGIERGNEKPRKDIAKWEDTIDYTAYFYEKPVIFEYPENLTKLDMAEILKTYKTVYREEDSQEDWFPRIREMSEELGYAKAPKLYKKNPEDFKGHVGDVSTVIRVAVTGRRNTPDLYQILKVLGKDEVMDRLNAAITMLENA